ncbi:hypothetical protein E8E14_003880 [Neopestalotiopsis sp. 37M]|nr:hypothetical protein E8E14_003880 [Neopestalotiopsis sp. 37M]
MSIPEKAVQFEPMLAPTLDLPTSDSVVDVRVIDTKTLLAIDPSLFLKSGKTLDLQGLHAPIYCFLVSSGTRHVVFDLGVRRDWEDYSPRVVTLIKETTTITSGTDVASTLDDDRHGLNICANDVEAVIWSHNHFDHIGDPATFPSSTSLVVGPGVKEASWPGWPSNPEGIVRDSDAAGRTIHEVTFDSEEGSGFVRIGPFTGFDYFGNGSFYLLNAPGHAIGHMCGLARVQPSPNASFVLMGADACHHPGVLRPSPYFPLPAKVPHAQRPGYCPGELLQQLTLEESATSSFFTLPRNMIFPDHEAALETIRKIQELDASDRVFVIIAHDLSIRASIPLFPKTVNDWQERRLKTETRWHFCSDFQLGEYSIAH